MPKMKPILGSLHIFVVMIFAFLCLFYLDVKVSQMERKRNVLLSQSEILQDVKEHTLISEEEEEEGEFYSTEFEGQEDLAR